MTTNQSSNTTLVAIRAAHHAETTPRYDRVVFEFRGPLPLLEIAYVKQLLGDGSGLPITIAGQAIVQLQFKQAQAHNEAGDTTAPGRIALNLPLAKEVVRAGDFEGVVTYGIGLGRKAELRILTLAGANRVVIDILA